MDSASRITHLMGTKITTKIWADDPEAILDQVESLLYLYKNRFSANDADSELMKINHAAGKEAVVVSPDLFELISLGKEHSLASNSFLNITIGPLIQSWRIGFSDARLPSQAEIDEKLSLIDPKSIQLDKVAQTVYLEKEGMAIDLGALAKGYIADRIVDHLKRMGVTKGLINLGGNVLVFGKADHNADGLWHIGIQDPRLARGYNAEVLAIESGSVVTSGVYERMFTVEGKTYHHIFDSSTGYPIETDIASLTILAERSVDCEIWTTRLFGASPRQIFDQVNQTEGIEAVIILTDGQIIYTNGLLDKFL